MKISDFFQTQIFILHHRLVHAVLRIVKIGDLVFDLFVKSSARIRRDNVKVRERWIDFASVVQDIQNALTSIVRETDHETRD